LFAVVTVGAVRPFAQATPPASTLPAVTTLSVRGTIDKYDRSTRTLVLSTPTGTVQFPVVATTRIRHGWHKVDLADLPALAGDRATVRYTESSGNKTVESVHVFDK
jgi:hypothetical protein